jgi:hypothetical protein
MLSGGLRASGPGIQPCILVIGSFREPTRSLSCASSAAGPRAVRGKGIPRLVVAASHVITMAAESQVVVATARYVLLPLANLLTGYSVKAMERKIERGDWQEGKVWRRAPDGRILIDVMGYQRWVEDDTRR